MFPVMRENKGKGPWLCRVNLCLLFQYGRVTVGAGYMLMSVGGALVGGPRGSELSGTVSPYHFLE